ncbi:hypothetical protein LJ655_15410 [Paraburkholderia sp. MMS20-SJTN17]|uniref:DUF4148 domain-containing protein n=1 Tax=Paraburkholderia translucens TaxID=2886945 RepID=A0ABS8KER6_9BURK|nr:hypothetical protein [Paraburkholderia sp. MMS20-SJTN17]MCC8403260.1 hypothetical protein [Paraburkholderia sp. MMS20-SJTN17]
MSRLTKGIAATFVAFGLLTSGAAFAEQPANAAPQVAEAASAPATVHSDPIVQKRMEIREANREERAKRAEARKTFRAEAREARQQRNASVSESRDRARAALAESAQPGTTQAGEAHNVQ